MMETILYTNNKNYTVFYDTRHSHYWGILSGEKFIDEPLVIADTAAEVIDILETKLKGK